MNLHFETLKELEDFIKYIGYVKADAKPAPKPRKKAETVPVAETAVETPQVEAEVMVTHEDLIKYIQANCSDNIQAVKDMLAAIGVAKVSDIPEARRAEALGILGG